MLIVLLVCSLLLAILAGVFALQNAMPVTVVLFQWRFEGSLAIVILVSLLVGILIALFLTVPVILRHRWTIGSLRRRLTSSGQEAEPAEEPPAF